MEKQEKSLWQILKEQYGFKNHVYEVPINQKEQFRKDFLPDFWLKLFPVKTRVESSDDWMSTNINGTTYEVLMVDSWYVELRKNGVQIFNERRFENENFLKLLV